MTRLLSMHRLGGVNDHIDTARQTWLELTLAWR